MASNNLNRKVALVTGASKGIGAAIVQRLAQDGAAVVVNYSASADHAQAIVDGIGKAAGRAFAVRADVSKVWLPLASRCAKGGLTDSGRTPVGQWNCSRVWLLNARADFLLRAFAPAIDRVGN